jgi:hypothetical protein
MTHPTRWLLLTVCLLTASWVVGCAAKGTPGPNVPLSLVETECKDLKNPELRARVAAYRDLIRARMDAEAVIDKKLAEAAAQGTAEDEIARLKTDREADEKVRMALFARYEPYIKALVRRGIDVAEFRIQDEKQPVPEIGP